MSDDDLERMTGEPHIDGYPLYSGLPTGAPQGEAVGGDITLPPLPEPFLQDHPCELWGQNVAFDLFTPEKMHTYARAAVLLDRQRRPAPSAPPDTELSRLRALVAAHREHPNCGDPLHPGCVDCEDGAGKAAAPQGEPAFYFADDGGAMLAIFRTRSEWEDFCANCGPLDSGALYAGPQTAAPSVPAGWIACSERMPDDGAIVLVTWANGSLPYYALACMARGKLIDEKDGLSWGAQPTHWMPLPAPPDTEDER